ncbi:hypothetical protein SFC65_19150 [Priestia filamentosa]|uniref:hypothetical protein n=1 Tax=Priestia filamentosa TaxID=1402861 RepID=UPI00398298E6
MKEISVMPHQVENILELIDCPSNIEGEMYVFTYGYVKESEKYAFVWKKEPSISCAEACILVDGECTIQEVTNEEYYKQQNIKLPDGVKPGNYTYTIYVMEKPTVSFVTLDFGTPFEQGSGVKFNLNSKDNKVSFDYISDEEYRFLVSPKKEETNKEEHKMKENEVQEYDVEVEWVVRKTIKQKARSREQARELVEDAPIPTMGEPAKGTLEVLSVTKSNN